MKPGWKSTEFWLSLVGVATGIWQMAEGNVNIGMALVAAPTAAYPVSRGIAKRGNGMK